MWYTVLCCLLVWPAIIYLINAETTRTVWTQLSSRADLTCEHPPSPADDPALLYLWFKDSNPETIYSFDNRDISSSDAHWYDDEILGQRATFYPSKGPPTLSIDPVVASDQGFYLCRVQFKRSPSAYSAVNLSIIIPPDAPVVQYEGEEVLGHVGPLLEGERFDLVCRVRGGHPTPQISWWHNGREFVSPQRHESIAGATYHDAHLSLTAVRRYHSGKFKCRTLSVSPDGHKRSEIKTNSVSLNITLSPVSVKLSGIDSPLSAGTTALIACRATGSSPPAHVTLFKDSKPLLETTFSLSDGGNVTSVSANLRVSRKDNGVPIKCKATNSALPGMQQEASTLTDSSNLNVFYKPHVVLKLGRGLNSSNIIEGQDAFLQCLVDANPPPHKIEWFKDGSPIRLSTKLVLRSTDLALQRLERNNSGLYRCTADNLEGKARSNEIRIDVKHVPVCAQHINKSHGEAIGTATNISCHVWANPKDNITFQWSKLLSNGRENPVSQKVYQKGISSFLEIPLTHIGEFGTFLCRAANVIGMQKVPCRIEIEPAGPPYGPEECSASADGDTLVVSCRNGFDGGLPQRFFMEIQRGAKIIASETSKFPSWTIEGLEGGVDLSIHVWSSNAKGNSSIQYLEAKMPTFNQQSVTGQHVTEDQDLTFSPATIYGVVIGALLVILFIFTVTTLLLCRKFRRRRPKSTEELRDIQTCSPDVVASVQNRGARSLYIDDIGRSIPAHDEWIETPSQVLNRSSNSSCLRVDTDDGIVQYHVSQMQLHHLASMEDDLCSEDEPLDPPITRSSRSIVLPIEKPHKNNGTLRASYTPRYSSDVSQSLIRNSSRDILSAKESSV